MTKELDAAKNLKNRQQLLKSSIDQLNSEINELYRRNYNFQTATINSLPDSESHEVLQNKRKWLRLKSERNSLVKDQELIDQKLSKVKTLQTVHAKIPLEKLDNGVRIIEEDKHFTNEASPYIQLGWPKSLFFPLN